MGLIDTSDDRLKRFVRESNAIEGIGATPGQPQYDDHLDAARTAYYAARHGTVIEPVTIHSLIMRNQPYATPGRFRTVGVTVGGEVKMPPERVPVEYRKLLTWVDDVLAVDPEPSGIWGLHHRFEWIHPFIDGNGRTGRLWMNGLRIAAGLPWLTVRADDRQAYYALIREWELNVGGTL